MPNRLISLLGFLHVTVLTLLFPGQARTEEQPPLVPVGVAQVDITPRGPIRLAGYASRETETETIAQPLWAKALVIGEKPETMTVLVMVDSCGVPDDITIPVARVVQSRWGVAPERVVIASTHSHSAPWLNGFLPHHSASPIPSDHAARLTEYSQRLRVQLIQPH